MVGRRYNIYITGTIPNSTTNVFANVTGGTTIRTNIYDIVTASTATPADNAAEFYMQRSTTAGSGGTAITPQALDAADPAAVTACQQLPSVQPTLTSNAILLAWSHNQRATFRWVAAPNSELVVPATSANGIALVNPAIGGSAVAYQANIMIAE
jgi:hypothetical protein